MGVTRKAFEKYQLLVIERAHSFHRTTGLDLEDLIAEGYLIFCQTYLRYSKNYGVKFSTYLYTNLTNKLSDYIVKQKAYYRKALPLEKCKNMTSENNSLRFMLLLASLSKEAQFVVNVLLKSPQEVWEIAGEESARAIRGKLYTYLRKNGWQHFNISDVFREIKTTY